MMDIDAIIDRLDIAAKRYPLKALAPELKGHLSKERAESTLRGELNGQPNHKLGFYTAIRIMDKTGDLSALDLIEDHFNRVAFKLPKSSDTQFSTLIEQTSLMTKEFGEAIAAIGESIRDGKLTMGEIRGCLKEIRDAIKTLVKCEAYLNRLAEDRKNETG